MFAVVTLLAATGCATASLIRGSVPMDASEAFFGDASLDPQPGAYELRCRGSVGDPLVLYFLRPGSFPQVNVVHTPKGEVRFEPGPWKKLPDERGILVGVVCDYGAGGRKVNIFEIEEFIANRTLDFALNGTAQSLTTDSRGVFMLPLAAGTYQVKPPWGELPHGVDAIEVEIKPGTTTILDACRLTTLYD